MNSNIGNFTIPVTYKQQTPNGRKKQESDDRDKIDIKSDVNRPASGKLRKYTTVSSQCEILS